MGTLARLRAYLAGREAQVCAAVLLLCALANWPYGYYQFLRLAVCAAGAFTAWLLWRSQRPIWAVVMAGLCLLFTPIHTVHFRRDEWAWINILAALVFLVCPLAKQKHLDDTDQT